VIKEQIEGQLLFYVINYYAYRQTTAVKMVFVKIWGAALQAPVVTYRPYLTNICKLDQRPAEISDFSNATKLD